MEVKCDELAEAIWRIKADKYRRNPPNFKKYNGDGLRPPPRTRSTISWTKSPPIPGSYKESEDCVEKPYNSMPLSSSGLSAGADDPLVGILDLDGTNSMFAATSKANSMNSGIFAEVESKNEVDTKDI